MSLNIVNSALRNHAGPIPLFDPRVDTIDEIRLARLTLLRDKYGSVAGLLRALKRPTRDATLSQLLTRAPDSKTGKPRQMGSVLARKIEASLSLPTGWTDQPISPPPGAVSADTTPLVRSPAMLNYLDEQAILLLGFEAATPERRALMLALARSALEQSSPLAKAG